MPTASDIYDIGDGPYVVCTFRNTSDVATDPSAITARVKTPAGTTTTFTYGTDAALEKTATGVYRLRVTFDAAGRWAVKFFGTGTIVAAAETIIRVRTSAV